VFRSGYRVFCSVKGVTSSSCDPKRGGYRVFTGGYRVFGGGYRVLRVGYRVYRGGYRVFGGGYGVFREWLYSVWRLL